MHKMMAMVAATPGQVAELARWYDEVHIPALLSVPGMVSAERHLAMPMKSPAGVPAWDFLLIYEMAGDDPTVVLRALSAAADRLGATNALASHNTLLIQGTSLGKRHAEAVV